MNQNSNDTSPAASVVVRRLETTDIDAIQEMHRRSFDQMTPWTRAELESQIELFPEGQIGIEVDGELVASSNSLIVYGEDFFEEHTFEDACADGMITNHDPEGDTLYGIDIVVDPEMRGQRLARRIYDARKTLATRLNLERILVAGRIPGYSLLAGEMTPLEYMQRAVNKRVHDPVLNAQLSNGFAIRKLLPGYLEEDVQSAGNAVLMEWLNPLYAPGSRPRVHRVRVGSVQYQMRAIESWEDFEKQCRFFVQTASDYRIDILCFPELLTNQLMSLVPADRPALTARRLSEFTERYVEFFSNLAIRHNVNIIGGSHLNVEDDVLYNIAYLFHRDGGVDKQYKLHITPSEQKWWGVQPGSKVEVFETDVARICILICYDVEFPETARIAAQKGAHMLFVPYNTDIRSGHQRVRICSQARAVENHMYVIMSGACGNLPQQEGSDIHYAQSAILTPSDVAFARDAVAEEATPNAEMMLVHDLDLDILRRTRRSGSVRTWLDRRRDLYRVTWREGDVDIDV